MRALVIYESMFGNTQRVAEAIGRGLAARVSVDVVEVGHAPLQVDDDVDLVVVGGPTHAFGLSSERTRRSAAEQAPTGIVSTGRGVREWVACLASYGGRLAVAAFDTHIDKTWVPGAAWAPAASKGRHSLWHRAGSAPAGSSGRSGRRG